jgi:endonuclease/exonuclease/phosphatase family metal-dependent hydrolase
MKVLTLNMFLRPTLVNSYYTSFKSYWKGDIKFKDILSGDYKDTRLDLLLEHIKSEEYDIICLQEIFSDSISSRISKIKEFSMENNYYMYMPTETKTCRSFTSCGLCVMSKYPIMDTEFVHYKTDIYFPNVLSNCGFIVVKLNYKDIQLTVIDIHLQSGISENQNSIRYKQMDEIYDYLNKNSLYNTNTIITGDFNADLKLWKYIQKKFQGYIDPFKDTMLNDVYTYKRHGTNEVQRFDGIIYNLPTLEFNKIESKVDPIKIDKVGYFEQISDHYAVITKLF